MRVLMINKFYDLRGGTERLLFDLSASLEERGHEVVPFATHDPRNEATQYARFFPGKRDYDERSRWTKLRLAARAIHDGEAKRMLGRLLDEFPCDVAHLHNIYHQLSPSILEELRARRIPALMTVHDYKLVCPNYRLFRNGAPCERCVGLRAPVWAGIHGCQRESSAESWLVAIESTIHRLSRSYERGVDVFVTPSHFLRSMLLRQGYREERVRHIRNAPRMAGAPGNDGTRSERPSLLYAGRLSEEKGVRLLVEGAAQLPSLELRIAGTGPEESALRQRAAGLANVEFLGQLGDGELARERSRCWATALPAVWYENAPMAVIESFAAGRAVLVADHGGLREMVEDGVQGWRIPPGDAVAWAGALRRVCDEPAALERMGEEARRSHAQLYSHETMLEAYVSLYEELIAANRVSSSRAGIN